MDFPNTVRHKPVISSALSAESVGYVTRSIGVTGAPASGAWPAANRAIFVPFTIASPFQVRKFWWANGATVSSNVDGGIYSVGGTLLASTGSTAQAGASVVQSVSLSLLLTPGSYYMALADSQTANGTFLRYNGLAPTLGGAALGMAQQASALPLPATATFATIANAYLPLFGITSASVI